MKITIMEAAGVIIVLIGILLIGSDGPYMPIPNILGLGIFAAGAALIYISEKKQQKKLDAYYEKRLKDAQAAFDAQVNRMHYLIDSVYTPDTERKVVK